MKSSTAFHIDALKDGIRQGLRGLAFLSPIAGALTGYSMNFTGAWLAGAFQGMLLGPVLGLAAVGLFAAYENGFQKTWEDIKALKFSDVKNFLSPKNLLHTGLSTVFTGLKNFLPLLPGVLGSSAGAFGAVVFMPGVALGESVAPTTIFSLPFLLPAVAVTLGGYIGGHMLGSKLVRMLTRDPGFPVMPPENNTERMGNLLGKLMPYHEPGMPAVFHRHPLSLLAIGAGIVLFGIASAGLESAVWPLTMLGGVAGGALTMHLQREAAGKARGHVAGVTETQDAPVGATQSEEPPVGVTPSRVATMTLKDKFGTAKQEEPVAQPQPAAKLSLLPKYLAK